MPLRVGFPMPLTCRPATSPPSTGTGSPTGHVSEPPNTGGATGPLNLTVKLGNYGDRLLRAHKRLIYFIQRDLADTDEPAAPVRELAGRYADALDAQLEALRQIEAGERPEVLDGLEPSRYFATAR